MSQHKYYWYGIVKKMIIDCRWQNPTSFQEWQIRNAIESALQETKKLNNSEMRLKAIELILFKGDETNNAFAIKNHYEWHTTQKWITSFVKMVGKKAGY